MRESKRIGAHVGSSPHTRVNIGAHGRVEEILGRLNDHSVVPALDYLIECGAQKEILVDNLYALAFPPFSSTNGPKNVSKNVLGIDLRQARQLAATLRSTAGMMERLRGVDWRPGDFHQYEAYLNKKAQRVISVDPADIPGIHHIQRQWLDGIKDYMERTPRDFHEAVLLPCFLSDFADALERHLKALHSLRKHPSRTAALCQLVWHVEQKTHAHHDSELSMLIGAAEEKTYTTNAHEKWRTRNKHLVKLLGPHHFYPLILPAVN